MRKVFKMQNIVNLVIDDVEVSVESGSTILDAAKSVGIEIPSLCHLKDLGPFGACGVCVVEIKDSPKLARACATKVSQGMVVYTKSEKALAARKFAVELIMGDHDADCQGPCKLNCPAHTDCQKYIKEIANGDYAKAVSTVMEVFPLPASVGRVCPHPCEKACRRKNVESAISIAHLKAFAADMLIKDGKAVEIKKHAPTGKSVGIIGGGPAGLTAAFKLARSGHDVTIYDQMPEMGGMLRYGIPEYRLPKKVLKHETEAIKSLGVKFVNNFKIGRDASLDEVRAKHDGIIVANGAWKASSMRVKGEESAGVWGGIDLLRLVASGERPNLGSRVAIVGGGNTAMDACRTAVRLGAKDVFVIYRRTRNEMPAEQIEIEEAIEEGVKFKFLSAPDEILTKDGRVTGMRLQIMELGEADDKGRRKPVPISGKFETIELDSVISAIGQRNDPEGFDLLKQTEKGTIAADECDFSTNLEGVFACGDSVNKGASIAIEAIAKANTAACALDAYLKGAAFKPHKPILSERSVTEKDFTDIPRQDRCKTNIRPSSERKLDFNEVYLPLSEEVAQKEARRCLECGCHDFNNCALIRTANLVKADTKRLRGEFHPGFVERKLIAIERNQRKCILCNLCVRTCQDLAHKGLLGLVGRGFTTVIKPEFRDEASIAQCKDCHLCADNCPTGALKIL